MMPLNCGATRRRLDAYHDGELAVKDQIAVASHLEWCDGCAEIYADMRGMRSAFQALGHGRASQSSLSSEQAAVFTANVVNRAKAERDLSLFSRVREMFDDMHLVYAGVGATVATAFCVIIMLSMMRFATNERPDSLAAIMTVMATPLECESGNDFADASGCRARWMARFQRANETAEQDAVFALEAVITHQGGRLANLEALRGRNNRHTTVSQAKLIEGLLDAVSRARFDATQALLMPDLNGVVWFVEHATVRASTKPALDLPLPPKKRAAAGGAAASRLVRA